MGFVLTAHDQAHLTRPEQGWGQVVFEQEAGSVLKRYDEVGQFHCLVYELTSGPSLVLGMSSLSTTPGSRERRDCSPTNSTLVPSKNLWLLSPPSLKSRNTSFVYCRWIAAYVGPVDDCHKLTTPVARRS